MAQKTRNVDYESMVEKYMNEWDGCNLRGFCLSEKVNVYRMLKTMKKMGVKKEPLPHGLKPLKFSELHIQDVIYPDNVRQYCYYYRHDSFVKDFLMILCIVLWKKMK